MSILEFNIDCYVLLMLNMKKGRDAFIFLPEFKLGHNAFQSAANISRVWDQGSTCDLTAWCWFLKFISTNIPLEDEDSRGRVHVQLTINICVVIGYRLRYPL